MTLVWATVLGVLPFTVSGCGGICAQQCETFIACAEEDLQASGCSFDDSDEELIEECEDECNRALDKLNGDEPGEADACLSCVFDEIGEPDSCDPGDLNDAISDCEDECEEDGAEEFYEEFLEEFTPDIQCGDVGPG